MQEKIKIILYTVLDGSMAGGQKACLDMMRAAANAGYKPVLLSHSAGPFTELAEKEGIKVIIVNLKRSFFFHKIPALIKILKGERIDLVHTNDYIAGNILMRLAAFIRGVPVISHIHARNIYSKNPASRIFAKTLDNVTARLCIKIIAVSHYIKEELVSQGYPAKKIDIIYNGITRPVPAVPPSEHPVGSKHKTFVHVGRLCPDKGQADLVSAASRVLREFPDTDFLFIGKDFSGSGYKSRLMRIIRDCGITRNIRFVEDCNDPRSIIRSSDCLVLPSYEEGFPIAVLEAMAEARPVVAYDTGGVSEAVKDKVTGYLVPAGDLTRLEEAISVIIEKPLIAKEMGERGYERSAEFDLERTMNKILELYKKVEN